MAAEYFSDSSDAEIYSDIQPLNGGIQPYRFEPTGQRSAEISNGDIAGNNEVHAAGEPDDDAGPFTQAINFEERVGQHASDWCVCDRCSSMDNPIMNLCCHELEALGDKLYKEDLDCITQHSEFNMVVLAKPILRTALVAMKDVKRASLVEPISERAFRLAAYRQFTWWTHDRLGKKVRKFIPACVVNLIRETYPELSGEYIGFRDADETDTVYPD